LPFQFLEIDRTSSHRLENRKTTGSRSDSYYEAGGHANLGAYSRQDGDSGRYR
jgi:hypothetical protein